VHGVLAALLAGAKGLARLRNVHLRSQRTMVSICVGLGCSTNVHIIHY
jgi:hypothetical protein